MGGLREDEAAAKLRSELAAARAAGEGAGSGAPFRALGEAGPRSRRCRGNGRFGRRAQPRQLVGRPCLEGGHGVER